MKRRPGGGSMSRCSSRVLAFPDARREGEDRLAGRRRGSVAGVVFGETLAFEGVVDRLDRQI
jgi:hypothetical protein